MKRGAKKPLCTSFTPRYSHLSLPFSSRKSFQLPFGHRESPFYPRTLSTFAQKASNCNNSLSRRISDEMPPIVRLTLLQPLGKIMRVYRCDSQVTGARSVHMAVPLLLADGRPRALALKQRGFFLLLPGRPVDRFIGFLLSSCQLIVLQ